MNNIINIIIINNHTENIESILTQSFNNYIIYTNNQ